MDWNWFFSALAQSTAAIVGLLAAFIVTKTITNQADFKRTIGELQTTLTNSIKLVDLLNARYFIWYNEGKRKEGLKELKSLHPVINSDDPKRYYKRLDFSIYDNIEIVLNLISKEINKPPPPERKPAPDFSLGLSQTLNAANDAIAAISDAKQGTKIREEGELIDRVITDVKDQARKVNFLLARIVDNPETSGMITISILAILVLFYAGVIYPLSFLPYTIGSEIRLSLWAFFDIFLSLKGLMLLIVSVIFNAIMLVFLFVNLRLKYSDAQVQELNKYAKIENYSPYLKNMVENTRHISDT